MTMCHCIASWNGRLIKHKRKLLALFIVAAIYFCYINFNKDVLLGFALLKPWSSEVCKMAIAQKRRLAATIADVHREIYNKAGTKAVIDGKLALKLAEVIAELDPRIELTDSASSVDHPKLQEKDRHVCPEVNNRKQTKTKYYQHGIDEEKCSYVPKFSNVLTVILPAFSWDPGSVVHVVKQIRKIYEIPIIALVRHKLDYKMPSDMVNVVEIGENEAESDILNAAVSKVETPFTFLGLKITDFNNQTSLERLVRVLDELDHVRIAGGATINHQGHWSHGCLQQRMADYKAHYIQGYYYSKQECMYCDDILNPFVTRTKWLIDNPFTKGMQSPSMYRDWFVKVRLSGYLTISCPDVLFYTNEQVVMKESDWLIIAKQWNLETIHSFDGQVFNFSCESIGISCFFPLRYIFSFILPPCCRQKAEELIKNIANFADDHNMRYELNWGTTLAGVKLGGQMPWDFDADMDYECKDIGKWQRFLESEQGKDCSIHNHTQTYFTIHCPIFFVDMGCKESTSHILLPTNYQDTPTRVHFAGKYVMTQANPGLFSRNYAGLDDLKHIPHGRTKIFVDKMNKKKENSEINPTVWNYCSYPEHHSCLIHYPTDGNLPFTHPFLHP